MEMEQPNSPGTWPVDLRDCIDQLLKFVLESHANQTLEFDLGLPRDYCYHLLAHDFGDHVDGDGVPPSPLYKRLALVLYELITCTDLRDRNKEDWSEMLVDKGSQLLNLFKAINFELHVQEPFFTQLKDGMKTIEGRCAAGNYKRIATGALLLFNKCLVLEVEDVHSYTSFSEMLEAESLQKVLPGVKTIEEGVRVYRKFYTEEKERSNGVVAICVTKLASQPYHILATIISGVYHVVIVCIGVGNRSKWAGRVLRECAKAISEGDSARIQHLLWMLNELASPYGDCDQKLASYFLQALFCKATHSGHRCYTTLSSLAHKSHSFHSATNLILKFQELTPWTTFGHVASNAAILEALDGETNLHILDISNTLCTQWPTLLEALATRNHDTPRLKLTTVVLGMGGGGVNVMKEVRQRMDKFARLMGVPFELNVISGGIKNLSREGVGVQEGEALAVNCVGAFRSLQLNHRAPFIQMLKSFNPRVLTVVEEEADFTSTQGQDEDFLKGFDECLRYFTLYFEMLQDSFPGTSNERLMLERECSRSILRVLACGDGDEDNCERRERGRQWSQRLKEEFCGLPFSDDVLDDVKALLKRYRAGWTLATAQDAHHNHDHGIYLNWKDHPVVWASAWKP
ncbi:protein SHORT-ROOT-like [Senna tora]|uniref:Protein SHORT-ROOT-like n=1 Tax=Senna tora TaxID=362788 RepID=A0A834SMF6_9FABA|nr:protein SHORT-ROOT-like [Senna tora]